MNRERGVVSWTWLIVLLIGVSVCWAASPNEERHYYYRGRPILSMLANRMVASSVVLPVYGNVYPRGFYHVHVNVGQPEKPYFLDPDTGSDLTWLQCDAPCVRCTQAPHPLYKPSNDLVPCEDPLCISLQPDDHKCESLDQCDYEVEYADGGSSYGVLVRDFVPLNFTNGARHSPRLAIGCGYDQIPGSSYHPLDGVLGLGKGKASIVSQLHNQGLTRNVIGHCLSGRGGGYIFFGDGVYNPSRTAWTPMSRDYSKYYSPGPAELLFGGKATGIRNLVVIFDSGSSYTYFASQPYQALISMLRKELMGTSLRDAADDETLPLCWKGKKPFNSIRDVKKYFKPLALSFGNGGRAATRFEIAPESYLIISLQGNACLGILNGTEIGLQNYNIIGDISMQDKMVIYDNEKQMIGWGPANCDRLPKGKAAAS
ncbi:hypothetical protein Ancab_000433 [Ancistrocladus abbreviatus]